MYVVDKKIFYDKMKMIFKLKEGRVDLAKGQYKTRQMTELLTFLKSVGGNHVTVNDIRKYFEDKGISVGTTTIYRNIEKLVEEGLVTKYIIDGNSSACFQYIEKQEDFGKHISYHCKCEKCGKIIHMQCREIESLKQHMMEQHGFDLNELRTVFYGICSECSQAYELVT